MKQILIAVVLIALFPLVGRAQEPDCTACHEKLKSEKVVHAAVDMGCPSCHGGIDAKSMPHKKPKKTKGLNADQPDLCYGCHDKAKFALKNVHAAIGMGCTSCHNPHSSRNAKLLTAEAPDLCYNCHDKGMFTQKTVHAALGMGCMSCHNPHSSDKPKLLGSEQPDLCYGCHDKAKFTKPVVHAAVGMGCTGCHNPHSSKSEKLLTAGSPDVCFACHDKGAFGKKNVHSPVAGGMCTSCHSPHSTEMQTLLLKKPIEVCLECHPDVPKEPHAVTGFSRSKGRHPLGMPKPIKKPRRDKTKPEGELELPKKEPELMDPARPDRVFYCGSCHNPHSSDDIKLFRYPAKTTMDICIHCHKM